MNITTGKIEKAQKVVIYGPEGIGKSTFASKFPQRLFIDTEGSTSYMDISRFDKPSSFTMLLEQIKYVRDHVELCKTLVIDTADWAEHLCETEFCAKKQISGIEDMGYGKGYVYVAEDFGKMLNLLEEVVDKGINVVITAHAQMRKFEQPDELGAYDRWELKLAKKTAPLLKEWADSVLFANYKTVVINVDNQGAQKGKNKAQGGKRVMYTQHHPCWDAKNRWGLADEVDFDYEIIRQFIPSGAAPATSVPTVDKEKNPATTNEAPKQEEPKQTVSQAQTPVQPKNDIPKSLMELMIAYNVTDEEIQAAVASRGYYPIDTPISNYDANFIDGVLVGAWNSVYKMIAEMKSAKGDFVKIGEQMEIPFN